MGLPHRLILLTSLWLVLDASPALAQYSQAIFLELVRDPGRADVSRTARSLALAGDELGADGAEAAVTSPGSLMLGAGTDVVFSYGAAMYASDELVSTPKQLPPFDPTRATSPRSSTPIGLVSVATRRRHWAAAAFYDWSARSEHTFATEQAELYSAALYPTLIIERGTGQASLSHSTTRVGGSVALGDATKRAGVGVSVSMVRLHYLANATDTIEVVTRGFDLVTKTFCCVVDRDGVEFDQWKPSIAVSGVVTPVPHLTLAARWRHEPTYTATRALSVARDTQQTSFTDEVRFRVPDVYGFGAIVAGGGTTIATEVARARYADVFSPVMSSSFDPNYICGQITVTHCPGWNFPYHETKDATTVRAALEQDVRLGPGRLVLRAGIAHEAGYTLARSATHESTQRTTRLPAPEIVTPFEPPREDWTWLSGGGAYRWRRGEVGVGVGHARQQTRVLADLRLRVD